MTLCCKYTFKHELTGQTQEETGSLIQINPNHVYKGYPMTMTSIDLTSLTACQLI